MSKKKSVYGLLPLLLLVIFASKKFRDDQDVHVDMQIDQTSNNSFEMNVQINDDVEDDINAASRRSSPNKQKELDMITPKIILDTSFSSGNQEDMKDRCLQSGNNRAEQAYETSKDVKQAKKLLRSFTTSQLDEKKSGKKTPKEQCNALLSKFPFVLFCSTMPKEFVKVVVNTMLDAGKTVDDLPQFFIDTILSIFVKTNWKGLPKKAAFKVTEFCKKGMLYKLKVLTAFVMIALVFGSFYLFAWNSIQEYFLQLGNPIHEKDRKEMLQSFLLTTFILILKVPITAIMPLLAGPFGVLISIMFPLSAVFVATFFSGIGLGFWYLVKKITGVDVIGWIGDSTACGPLEFMFGEQWDKEMNQEKFNKLKNEYRNKKGSKKQNMKEFYKLISEPVTCTKDDGPCTKAAKMAKLAQTMIFMRVFFPGIGDSLLNTFAMRYNIGFPELFVSLWLGLPENAFTSYALQIVKHPWMTALLIIFLGGLSTITWIGKYSFRHARLGKSMCGKVARESLTVEDDNGEKTNIEKPYHQSRYDLLKKLSNIPIYIFMFVFTFFDPVNMFGLDAYYANKTMSACVSQGEFDDMDYLQASCVASKGEGMVRDMKMAWGATMGVIALITLAQLVRNNIPIFKSRNYDTGAFDNKETFAYKKEKALLEGTEAILNDEFESQKNYFNLEKENHQKRKNYAKYLDESKDKARKLINDNQSAKDAVATKLEHEKNDELKELYAEDLENLQKNGEKYEVLRNKILEEKSSIEENKI